ncbi:NAD(P)H-dependent glycerol-3-phosphate dehydrogenase [Deltaproteobacteria bacterium TL4]
METQKIGLLGAGAWGTALAVLMADNGHEVTMWAFEVDTVKAINERHVNEIFLPGVLLPSNLKASGNLEEVIKGHQFIIVSPPSHVTRIIAKQMRPFIRKDHCIIIASKGVEQHSLTLMSEIYREELEDIPEITVLSGPTFAKDVSVGLPTAAVIACQNEELIPQLQQLLKAAHFRVYPSKDLIGVQVGGTVKNVIAVATGICDGMELGLSARSALICRGMAEMIRLGVTLGGKVETFSGMSGLGDLVLTATGTLSRNYSLGFALGQGQKLKDYQATRQSVAEGVKNAVSLKEFSEKYNIEMPISSAVYDILYQDVTCEEALVRLLERELPNQELY